MKKSDKKTGQLLLGIKKALAHCGVTIQSAQISIDNEEACNAQHQGNWQLRLSIQ